MFENDLSLYLTRTICFPFKRFREECTKLSNRLALILSKAIDKWSYWSSVVWFDVLLLSRYWISGMQDSCSEWPVDRITKKWSIILPKAEERIVRWVRSIEQIKEIQSKFVVLAELFCSPGVRRGLRIMSVHLEVISGVFEQACAQLWVW